MIRSTSWMLICFGMLIFFRSSVCAEIPKRYALLVGISKYSVINSLKWSHRDVALVRSRLQKLGFAPSRIRSLVNEQATKIAMLREMKRLQRAAKLGDVVVFYYSGHGTVVPEPKKMDGCQMALAPYDTQMIHSPRMGSYPQRASLIEETVLNTWLRSFRTNHVLVVLDSCFSGGLGGARRALPKGARARFLPSNVTCRMVDKSNQSDIFVEIMRKVPFVVWTASHARQLSYEEDVFRSGVFTLLWLDALDELSNNIPHRFVDWIAAMKKKIRSHRLFRLYIPHLQQPRFLGDMSRRIFLWAESKESVAVRTSEALSVQMKLHKSGRSEVTTLYRVNESLQIAVQVNQAAWIVLCGRSSEGKLGQFFPNKYQHQHRLIAGKEYRFPPLQGVYTINAYGPPGPALFWIVANTRQQPTCGVPPVSFSAIRSGKKNHAQAISKPKQRLEYTGKQRIVVWMWANVVP